MSEGLALITALILNRGLCRSCIQRKSLMPSAEELAVALDRIGRVLVVRRTEGQMCALTTPIVLVIRPE
jgi:hypothetical protein